MLLYRYLLLELMGPFGLSLVIMGSLMTTGFVLFHLVEQAVQFHIPLRLFAQIFLLRIPEMLFYTLPMSMLLGTLIAIGRLNSDREVLIMRITGWSLWHISRPLLGFALLISMATIALNETLIPPSVWMARQLLHQAQYQRPVLPVSHEHLLFREMQHQQLHRLFYAQSSDGHTLQQVMVQEFENNRLRRMIRSQSAHLRAGDWIFGPGEMLDWDSQSLHQLRFSSYRLTVPLAWQALAQETRQPLEMNLNELNHYMQRLQDTGQTTFALQVRWHQKLAIPFAAVVFVLLGLAVGVQNQASRSLNVGLSILIVFAYYTLLALGTALGDTGQIPAWIGAWVANLVGLLSGIGLIWCQEHQLL